MRIGELEGAEGKVAIVIAAVLGQTVATAWLDSTVLRVCVVLGLGAVAIWWSVQLAGEWTAVTGERLSGEERAVDHTPRRFTQLRGQVDRLLTDVRRLNWIAVDARLGFREEGDAHRELNEVEERMSMTVARIRNSAGVSDRPSLASAEGGSPA